TQSKDPNIVKYIIYWNNRKQQMEVSADKLNDTQKVMIPNLAEGDYTFEIIAFDKAGNSSNRGTTLISGSSLGNEYASNLFIRGFSTINSQSGLILDFEPVDTLCKKTILEYKNLQGQQEQRIISDVNENLDTLMDIDPSVSSLKVTTAYMPEKGIDTFYVNKDFAVNLVAARYTCTGSLVDYTNAGLTGPYPWNVTLEQITIHQLAIYDEDYSKGIYHKIKSGTSNSYYGSFGVVINMDDQNKVVSVENKYGQPASNGRSGELDSTGINKFDPVSKILKVKYWMNENGNHRTLFDETFTMK
ncbi:DUF4998 domain-containing protein, partial [Arachidicoccus sp.]|uniref:DUF4998 domain-containing protein n=1 Tax=Arachidicoccus sp. TaxID=1872624 RepID=UPI003D1D8F83